VDDVGAFSRGLEQRRQCEVELIRRADVHLHHPPHHLGRRYLAFVRQPVRGVVDDGAQGRVTLADGLRQTLDVLLVVEIATVEFRAGGAQAVQRRPLAAVGADHGAAALQKAVRQMQPGPPADAGDQDRVAHPGQPIRD
jgi:hypothetical protein